MPLRAFANDATRRLGAGTSQGSPYPIVETSCSKDGDCELVGAFREGSAFCCTKCGEYIAGTHAWAERARTACRARGDCNLPSSCAEPTKPMFAATCSAGACTVTRQ